MGLRSILVVTVIASARCISPTSNDRDTFMHAHAVPAHDRSADRVAQTPPSALPASPVFLGRQRRSGVNKDQAFVSKKFREAVGIILFFTACSVFFGMSAWKLATQCLHFARHERAANWTFLAFLGYQFDDWFTRTSNASMIIIFVVFMMMLLTGTALYWSFLRSGIWHAAWITMVWLVGNDGGVDEKSSVGNALGSFMSLLGLLVFGVMLTLLHHLFASWIDSIKEGSSPVMERGHIIIIGHSNETIVLLQELCNEYKRKGGIKIVVLTQGVSKPNMEDRICNARIQLHGSRIIVRVGYGQSVEHLEFVSASLASRIIIMSDDTQVAEVRDAITMQILIALGSQGWPCQGRVLAEGALWKNKELLLKFGKDDVDVVMIDRWMARLLIESSSQDGLGTLCAKVLDPCESSFFVTPLPSHLVGKTFIEATAYYPDAVPLGVVTSRGQCEFGAGVGASRELVKGTNLILMAESEDDTVAKTGVQFELSPPGAAHMPPPQKDSEGAEIIMIFGWGHLIQVLLVELDKIVGEGTRVVIVTEKPIEDREDRIKKAQLRWEHPFNHIVQPCEHVIGQPGSQFMLDELPVPLEQATRIFILADDTLQADSMAIDACTMTTLLQIRNRLAAKGLATAIPIIPEIRNPGSGELCGIVQAENFLNSSGMRVQVLATLCHRPPLLPILRELFFYEGQASFQSRSLEDYLPPDEDSPRHLSFLEAQSIVCVTGDVVVGWTEQSSSDLPRGGFGLASSGSHSLKGARMQSAQLNPEYMIAMNQIYMRAHGALPPARVILNPQNKDQVRDWTSNDRLFVIGRYSRRSVSGRRLSGQWEDPTPRSRPYNPSA
mmetsp:Transcript_141991/g.247303  ORF Transcript_141991/g.247303 Transcript_141991/m.247303 type:complete len:837 (-) Transcript_141991:36-2546(-)